MAVEEGDLNTTTTMPRSEYSDKYEINDEHAGSIHNKSNITEKISINISDKIAAVDSLSPSLSTRSGQIYSESTNKAKVSYDIFTDDEIDVKGVLSMGGDDLDNH